MEGNGSVKPRCPECGQEVAFGVTVCPECGYPFRQKRKSGGTPKTFKTIGIVLCIIALCLVVTGMSFTSCYRSRDSWYEYDGFCGLELGAYTNGDYIDGLSFGSKADRYHKTAIKYSVIGLVFGCLGCASLVGGVIMIEKGMERKDGSDTM